MEVNPAKQNIDQLFSTAAYHIDFYQREYKWTETEVRRLLDDIFYQFDLSYAEHSDLDPSENNIAHYYNWYYLNTYITNKADGKIFVVDGQQRLTTISLMLVALYHLCSPTRHNLPDMQEWLKSKVAGVVVGGAKQFRIAHEKRHALMNALLTGVAATPEMMDDGITAKHMISNYELILAEFTRTLQTRHKLETFLYYFMCLVVIINLEVEQTDVPMVFEVINDRGIRLQPYEILKGKLLGRLDKGEVDSYTDIWETSIRELEDDEGAVDDFFRTYLRARFSDTRKQGQKYDGPYHRTIFDTECDQILHLKDPQSVKSFLKTDFAYYTKLYSKVRKLGKTPDSPLPECYYISELNSMDGHLMLAVSACSIDDPAEQLKIAGVCRAFDRAYVALQLNRAYDSNQFQELLYTISTKLRTTAGENVEDTINQVVLEEINRRRSTDSKVLLSYAQFKQVGYGDYNTRFLRYFLARIEAFVAAGLGCATQDTMYNFVRGQGKSNSYHIEHILARNDESKALFTTPDGQLDEATFEIERNRLGGLLLLKGPDNQSSGNECYCKKLQTYTGSAPYLAQTLVPDFYKSNAAMHNFKQHSGLKFQSVPKFTRVALEERSELLFEIVKQVWHLA